MWQGGSRPWPGRVYRKRFGKYIILYPWAASERLKYCEAKLGVILEKQDKQIVEILWSEVNTLTTKNQHLPWRVQSMA